MISNKIQDAFNEQINAELYSAYLYLSMSSYFESINLSGFSSWMKMQAQEETAHAMKFYNFINERGGRVALKAIDGPKTEWPNPVSVFEETLKHEQKVTSLINNLVNLAQDEKDHASYNFLQWFIDEQVEEEATADGILQQLKLIGESGQGIIMMDRELGARKFVPSTTEGE